MGQRTILPWLFLALACEVPAEVRAPIVGGEREPGMPAVVAVVIRGTQLCTGTLISPRVVLTAKHCIQQAGAEAPDPPADFVVGTGASIWNFDSMHPVARIDTTAGTWERTPTGGTRDLLGTDVALLTLEAPIRDVPPLQVLFAAPDDPAGTAVVAIGYGFTPEGEVGDKRRTTSEVMALAGNSVVTGPIVCSGDSGGPLLWPDGRVGAVASIAACDQSTIAGYEAVWPHGDLIVRTVAAAGECIDRGDERCDGLDDDCDERIDEGCLDLGAVCGEARPCALGTECAETVAGPRCSVPCALRDPRSCPEGLYCAGAGCEGWCVPGTRGSRAFDEPCERDTQCASLRCADPGDGTRRCLATCGADAADCLADEACSAARGCGVCVQAGIVVGRGLAEPCDGDAACRSGRCDDGRCTRTCGEDEDCPTRFACRGGRCVRTAFAAPGDPCTAHHQCARGRCVEGRCAPSCTGEETCPSGFACHEGACLTERMSLGASCVGHDECASRLCDHGTCTRPCDPDLACPSPFVCVRGEGVEPAVCHPPPLSPREPAGGGCAVVSGSALRAPWLALGLAALFRARRRRSRRGTLHAIRTASDRVGSAS